MTIAKVLGSKKENIVLPKDLWGTPAYLYEGLNEEFDFGLDAAANAGNCKCFFHIDEKRDAFKTLWWSNHGVRNNVFCNPPYSQSAGGLINWVERGYEQSQELMITVVMVVPGDTSTKYRSLAMRYGSEIRDLAHRVKFIGATGTPPWPTAIYVFRPIRNRITGGANVSVWAYKIK